MLGMIWGVFTWLGKALFGLVMTCDLKADSIHGIDQSVGARVENVAGDVLDYNVVPISLNPLTSGLCASDAIASLTIPAISLLITPIIETNSYGKKLCTRNSARRRRELSSSSTVSAQCVAFMMSQSTTSTC